MSNLLNTRWLRVNTAPGSYISLQIPAILLSVYPCVELPNLELALFDVVPILIFIWFGAPAALLTIAVAALVGFGTWGSSELSNWLAIYINSALLVALLSIVKTNFVSAGKSLTGLAYWVFFGAPISFLIFWLATQDGDYAIVSASQRLYSGIAAVTFAVTIHFFIVLIQHRLPDRLFGGPMRFSVRMREVATTAAIISTSLPLLITLWAATNNEIESSIETLFATSDARFESIAMAASSNIVEQRKAIDRLAATIEQALQEPNTSTTPIDELLLNTLGIEDALGIALRYNATSDMYISNRVTSSSIAIADALNNLDISSSSFTVGLTSNPNGPTGFVMSKEFPQLIIVYQTPLALWESLYRADMLGMMGSSAAGGIIDRVSHFHGPSSQQLYGIAQGARILREEYDYAIWVPPARNTEHQGEFGRIRSLKNSYITFQASDELINSFDKDLYDVDCFRYTVDFWSYTRHTLLTTSLLVFSASVLLLAMTALIEFFVARFTAPFSQLSRAMEHFSASAFSDASARYAFELKGTTDLFQRLAAGFGDMETEIRAATARTAALNLSYEGLLNQTKLAFVATDEAGNTQFTNNAAKGLLSFSSNWMEAAKESLTDTDVAPLTLQSKEESIDLLVSMAPRLNLDGQTDGHWFIASDVSALKIAERKLLKAQRMSTLGQLSTGMAHEINQPLQAMRLALANVRRLLKEPLQANTRAATKLEAFDGHIQQIAKLIQFMKVHGGSSSTQETQFNPLMAIEQVIEASNSDDRGTLHVTSEHDAASECRVLGDPEQFKLVISHILKNARDAADANQRVAPHWITIKSEPVANTLHIVAIDNCGGIADASLDYIFDPFYTTKDPDKGMGLGLSVSQGIIRSMGGEIEAANTGEGASIFISLPLS